MKDFETNQTAKMKTFTQFASPSEAIEALTFLAVALIQGDEISTENRKIIADCLMDYIQIKSRQIEGGKKGSAGKGNRTATGKFKYATEEERIEAKREAVRRYRGKVAKKKKA